MITLSETALRVVVLTMLGGHALQVFLFAADMNVRTTFAIVMFAGCAAFAERFTENRYAVPLLQGFGLAGMAVLMIVLQVHVEANA